MSPRTRIPIGATICCALVSTICCGATQPTIKLDVDATDASRHIFHSRLSIPIKAGPVMLYFPKWIPGDHSPAGVINGLTGLTLSANGVTVPWHRDDVDMYAFHCQAPQGTDALDVRLDFLSPQEQVFFTSGGTENLTVINWESLLLYPAGYKIDELNVSASLRLPKGWSYATPLEVEKRSEESLAFRTVSLATLIDSPLIGGKNFKSVALTSDGPLHELDIVSDSQAALSVPDHMMRAFRKLPAEAQALFGSRHYRSYRFLLTLSDPQGTDGLEHHECSDNRVWERYLVDDDARYCEIYLLPHEFIHSWNGKFRRPAGLVTADFQQPVKDELLWVYEGLTHYLCYMMSARAGFATDEQVREMMAYFAARLEHTRGRAWRPLVDTAVAAQLLYDQPAYGSSWRRSIDYYNEGMLIWLEADVMIRQKTNGQKSLDDFCRLFFAGERSAPSVKSYTKDDVLAALDSTCHADWAEFFERRIYRIAEHIPLGGIENGGWSLIYNDTPNIYQRATENTRKFLDVTFSIGLKIDAGGKVIDVVPGSSAAEAGVPIGVRLEGVNGRKYSHDLLRRAISESASAKQVIELSGNHEEFIRTYRLNYHGGMRYPHLLRQDGKPDLLSKIMSPLTGGNRAKD